MHNCLFIYRAADWNLQEPSWTGRMRLVSQGDAVTLKLEDKITGELFAKCPIEQYPGIAVEPVTDSSRYFALRIQDDNGRTAFIGVGFSDRSDSFDLNVALQDHFKWLKNRDQIEKEKEKPKEELDLRFKEGETIKINMKITVSKKKLFLKNYLIRGRNQRPTPQIIFCKFIRKLITKMNFICHLELSKYFSRLINTGDPF